MEMIEQNPEDLLKDLANKEYQEVLEAEPEEEREKQEEGKEHMGLEEKERTQPGDIAGDSEKIGRIVGAHGD